MRYTSSLEPGAHRRRADALGAVRERGDRGRVDTEVVGHRARCARAPRRSSSAPTGRPSRPEVRERVPGDGRRLTTPQPDLAVRAVRRRRCEHHRDQHHAEVHDETAVEARVRARRRDRARRGTRLTERPASAAHAEHELTDDPGGRERAEPVRDHLATRRARRATTATTIVMRADPRRDRAGVGAAPRRSSPATAAPARRP